MSVEWHTNNREYFQSKENKQKFDIFCEWTKKKLFHFDFDWIVCLKFWNLFEELLEFDIDLVRFALKNTIERPNNKWTGNKTLQDATDIG